MMSSQILGIATRALVQRRTRYYAALFAFLMMAALNGFGQEATIVGTITDSSGAAIPKVTVTATKVETGETRSGTTNDNGQYVMPGLPIGHYNVSAKTAGFGLSERNGIVLNVDDRTRVDFVMKVGTVQEQVTVEANAVTVQADSSEVSNVMTSKQLSELGVNGRSVYSLYALTPGASSIQADFVIPTPVSGDNNVSINGLRAGHNLQLLDGSENLDRGGTGASVMPSIDAIDEFRSLNSNYSAEYGLTSAATITNVIKSGGKQFHASAWEFVRNDALDARNYFNPAPNKVAELRFNVYGFNAGGQVPLFKEHPTFFFYNMEWRSLVQGGLTNQTVPFTDTYGGNFSVNTPKDALDVNKNPIANSGLHVPCLNQLSAAQIAAFTGAGITTFSTPTASGSCAVDSSVTAGMNPKFAPFPGSAVPAGLLNNNAQLLLKDGIFPAPTSGQQFIGGNNSPTNVREEIARVDHQFTDKFLVFGHWVSEQVSQTYGETQWSS